MSANTRELVKKLQPLIALVVMVVALSLLSNNFLTFANQRNILLQISVNVCLSIGMTLIILT
ncbi:MAG TPA: ribose ABC transporter permease, partial [Verrucomicrobiae bacterium]